tara:strand:- start:10087 stop:11283 length:1197 start_codon:yes stop_codon:yes gene_type:complete
MSLTFDSQPLWQESFGAGAVAKGAGGASTLPVHLRIARLKTKLASFRQRQQMRQAAGKKTRRADRRIKNLQKRIARLESKAGHRRAAFTTAADGSSNMSQYLYNPYIEMEDEEGALPGYNPYAEGALGHDDEDILAGIDPELLAMVEEDVDQVYGSLALDPHYAQMMEESDYGPEGYSDVAMSYMSPVEQVDDLFSPYIIERSGIEDFDMDEIEDMMGDDDFDDDDDDLGWDLDGLGGARGRARRSARRSRRGERQSARQSRRSSRQSSRQSRRSARQSGRQTRRDTRTAARLSKRQSGLESRRGVSSSGPPSSKASAATVTTQAVPSKRGAGGSGRPGPARNYQMTLQEYKSSPSEDLLEKLKHIWRNPMWKVAPQRRKLASPETVEAEHGSSNYYY